MDIKKFLFLNFFKRKLLCSHCKKYTYIGIGTPKKLDTVIAELQKLIHNQKFIQLKNADAAQNKNIWPREAIEQLDYKYDGKFVNDNDIFLDRKKYSPDLVLMFFQCQSCKNFFKLICETYHGSGGEICTIY